MTLWQQLTSDAGAARYHFGTRRTVSPAETLQRIRPLLPNAGITRLADVTGLDWLGIPVYQAIRPNSRNISVSQGKGLTRMQAQASALMESLEGFHAEELHQPTVRATVRELGGELGYDPFALAVVQAPTPDVLRRADYDPYAPPIGRPTYLTDTTPLDWVTATNLQTGRPSWVPRQLCELNFALQDRLQWPFFRASSNGLASGNSIAEAVVHGLCEVIERDAMWHWPDARLDPDRCIAHASINSQLAQRLLERFDQGGMLTHIVDVSGPIGLPCFEVFIQHRDSSRRYYGAGCHPSRTTALLRALTEAAQSRLAHITGSRDDLYRRTYGTRDAQPMLEVGRPLASGAHRSFLQTPALPMMGLRQTIETIVARISTHTGMPPMAVDLTRPSFDVPVVFVVAPGLHLQPPERR